MKGCKGPGCSQCRDLPRNQEDSCIPGKYLDDLTNFKSISSTYRSVAGGPALGLGPAGGGDTGVLGHRGPLSEDAYCCHRNTQTVVDHCALGRGLRDSDWTA